MPLLYGRTILCAVKPEKLCELQTEEDMKARNYPAINFGKLDFDESRYCRGNKYWNATTLLKAVDEQGCEAFDYPVACFDMSTKNFDLENMDDFVWQMKRTLNADYKKYPIILDDYGQIADGNHRLCHAILDGQTYVRAYRLQRMPEPDFVKTINNGTS